MMTLNHLRAEEVIFAHIQSLQTARTTNDIQESLKLITITDAIHKNQPSEHYKFYLSKKMIVSFLWSKLTNE
jgi:hypothetical protein